MMGERLPALQRAHLLLLPRADQGCRLVRRDLMSSQPLQNIAPQRAHLIPARTVFGAVLRRRRRPPDLAPERGRRSGARTVGYESFSSRSSSLRLREPAGSSPEEPAARAEASEAADAEVALDAVPQLRALQPGHEQLARADGTGRDYVACHRFLHSRGLVGTMSDLDLISCHYGIWPL